MGRDRPGIVAAVSARLLELNCNLEDVSTSVLQGHFSMMLVVAGPVGLGRAELEAGLAPLAGDGLATTVWEIEEAPAPADTTHTLTAYGEDSTGIVHALSSVLAGEQVGISDMVCRLHAGQRPIYVVTMEILVPPTLDLEGLRNKIAASCERLGLNWSLNEIQQAQL
jgi:predicted amino acid-binding ACT domain protein